MPVSIARAECPVCQRFFCVSAAGHLHVHGLRSDRFPGSNRMVSVSTLSSGVASLPSTIANTAHIPAPPLLLLPKAFHHHSHLPPPLFTHPVHRPPFSNLSAILESPSSCAYLKVLVSKLLLSLCLCWRTWLVTIPLQLERLLSFAPNHLYTPRRGGSRWSLAYNYIMRQWRELHKRQWRDLESLQPRAPAQPQSHCKKKMPEMPASIARAECPVCERFFCVSFFYNNLFV